MRNSRALARYSGPQFCDKGRIKTDNGIPVKVPGGELSVLQLEQEIHFQAIICKKKRSTMKAMCVGLSGTVSWSSHWIFRNPST